MATEIDIKKNVNQIEMLEGQGLLETLSKASSSHKVGIMTYLNAGKWQVVRVGIINHTEQCVVAEVLSDEKSIVSDFRINQPVGMSFQIDFVKYIFESVIIGVESKVTLGEKGRVLLELPDKIQKIQRRAYQRQPIPKELNVKVLFWHRGYLDTVRINPVDHYWQGQLADLSAGGLRVLIEMDKKDRFTIGQVVGLQFTPMYYQKPILAEGHLRYLTEDEDNQILSLGIEFLGLEVSVEGRQILQRLLDTVQEYERLNSESGDSAVSVEPAASF